MTDTYDRRIQLGASRRRFEDAEVLHSQKHWTGAIQIYFRQTRRKLIMDFTGKQINVI